MKWRVLAAAAMLLLSLIPQIHLWFVRGGDWNGAYAGIQGDEPAYSAYLNSQIDGRPRANDPFGGRNSVPSSPLSRNHLSRFNSYRRFVLSWFARVFAATASTAFIALAAIAAILSALSVFWLLT